MRGPKFSPVVVAHSMERHSRKASRAPYVLAALLIVAALLSLYLYMSTVTQPEDHTPRAHIIQPIPTAAPLK